MVIVDACDGSEFFALDVDVLFKWLKGFCWTAAVPFSHSSAVLDVVLLAELSQLQADFLSIGQLQLNEYFYPFTNSVLLIARCLM